MRVQKSDGNGNSTSFAYDGQMGIEDNEPQGNNQGVTDYGIGPRGIDRIAFTSGSGTAVSYARYDAWGNILSSDSSGDPKGPYCVALGVEQDDESGLVYMRARYCDPTTGRFVSEDMSLQPTLVSWLAGPGNS